MNTKLSRVVCSSLLPAFFVSFIFCLQVTAQPAGSKPPLLGAVGIDQLLNNQVPLDLEFVDESGRTVKLREYFTDKPVLLTLVYYECPQLCNQVLNGAVGALKTLPMTPGKDFIWLTISFDHREQSELAAAKKDSYLKQLGKPQAAPGWHFLTGSEQAIKELTKAVGFRFIWDPAKKQYAHASGIMVLTPEGKISRYFYGIEYAPRDLRLGFVDAGQGRIGTLADQIIMYCYQYDPTTGTYGLQVMRVLRIFAVLTILTLLVLFVFLRRKAKQKEAQWAAAQAAQSPAARPAP